MLYDHALPELYKTAHELDRFLIADWVSSEETATLERSDPVGPLAPALRWWPFGFFECCPAGLSPREEEDDSDLESSAPAASTAAKGPVRPLVVRGARRSKRGRLPQTLDNSLQSWPGDSGPHNAVAVGRRRLLLVTTVRKVNAKQAIVQGAIAHNRAIIRFLRPRIGLSCNSFGHQRARWTAK